MRLTCTAKRIGDYESRTEEYEISFTCESGETRALDIKYQAARAFEINAALDAAAATAREAISNSPTTRSITEETLAQFSWKAIQSAKYEEGATKTSHLDL